MFNLNNL